MGRSLVIYVYVNFVNDESTHCRKENLDVWRKSFPNVIGAWDGRKSAKVASTNMSRQSPSNTSSGHVLSSVASSVIQSSAQ